MVFTEEEYDLERFQVQCSVLGAMPTLAVGMFPRENRYTHDETALVASTIEGMPDANPLGS